MKKGFTLIELLMTIVVLGVIIGIATPILINMNREATLRTYKQSVEGVDRAARVYYDSNYLLEGTMEVNPMFDGETNIYSVLSLDGEKPSYSIVLIDNDGNRSIYAEFDSYLLCKIGDDIYEVEELTECVDEYYKLPDIDDVRYIYNPTDPDYSENASPCVMEGSEITHVHDIRDDEVYLVTKVGNQCWFQNNLKYTGMGCLDREWTTGDPDACRQQSPAHGNEVSYQWLAAMDGSTIEGSQGLCPSGWRVPTHEDFKDLEIYLGMDPSVADNIGTRGTDQGSKLKSDVYLDGTNESGFSAKASGAYFDNGTFQYLDTRAYFWTSSITGDEALRRRLEEGVDAVNNEYRNMYFGYSIRCVMDN